MLCKPFAFLKGSYRPRVSNWQVLKNPDWNTQWYFAGTTSNRTNFDNDLPTIEHNLTVLLDYGTTTIPMLLLEEEPTIRHKFIHFAKAAYSTPHLSTPQNLLPFIDLKTDAILLEKVTYVVFEGRTEKCIHVGNFLLECQSSPWGRNNQSWIYSSFIPLKMWATLCSKGTSA